MLNGAEIFRRKSVLTNRSGSIVILIGVLIILTGITLMGLQMLDSSGTDTQNHSFKLIGVEAGSTKFQIETTSPGLLVTALGIILLITGAILSR
jgi:uncharacterized membrane protein